MVNSGKHYPARWRLASILNMAFVITNKEDFEWVTKMTQTYNLFDAVKAVHCSPVMAQEGNSLIQGCEALSPPKLADWVLASGLPFHCHLQLHKYIWSPTTRGV